MKKYFQIVIIFIFVLLCNVVPMHAAQEQEVGEQVAVVEQSLPAKKESLSLRQRAVKQFNESINRLKKCARLQCDRTEFLKALRDVAIAGGTILTVRSGYQYATRNIGKEWADLRPHIRAGESIFGTAIWEPLKRDKAKSLIERDVTDMEAKALLVATIISYDHELFDALLEAGVDLDNSWGGSRWNIPLLFYAILHQNAYAVEKLLDRMTDDQIARTNKGWDACSYAKEFAENPWDFLSRTVRIVGVGRYNPELHKDKAEAIVRLLEDKGACLQEMRKGEPSILHAPNEMAPIFAFPNTYLP